MRNQELSFLFVIEKNRIISNAPSWSLLWEYAANIFYAFVLCKVGPRALAAVGICVVSYRAGNLLGGWSKDNFLDGGARVAYSFSAGLFLYRSNWIIKNRLGFISLAILLFLACIMPGSKWNWLTETLVVVFYFPLLVPTLTRSWTSVPPRGVRVLSGGNWNRAQTIRL